ncbi:MAG: putative ABC transporter permease subunit [Capsulimonadaceae bacterium]
MATQPSGRTALRMFRVLFAARLKMLRNAGRELSTPARWIISSLVLFAMAIFGGIGVACAALVLVMQGGAAPGSPLTPAAVTLVSHIYQYLFFFLLAGSVPYVASSLFQDNDLPLLLTTPTPPASVIGAKMVDATATNASQFIVLGVPVLIGLGWGVGLSAPGWACCLVSIALLIILTPALSACLLLLLATVFGMRRVRYVVMIVSVVLALGITLLAVAGASRATQGGSMDFRRMQIVLSQSDSARSRALRSALTHSLHGAAPTSSILSLHTAGPVWLPSTWAATVALDTAGRRGIHPIGLEAVALMGCMAALLLSVAVSVGSKVVASDTILEQQDLDSFGRRENANSRTWVDHARRIASRTPMGAVGLVVKDLRYVGRDTILLGQIGTTLILFLVPFVLKLTQSGDTVATVETYGDLSKLMITLVIYMVTSIIGLSSVGLEGRGVWIVLAAPMTRGTLLRAKWVLSYGLSLLIAVVMVAIAALAFNWPLMDTLGWIGIIACACYALSGLGVGLGGLFPRFLYDNPAHRASVWAMILGFVFSSGYVVLTVSCFVVSWLAYGARIPQANAVALVGVVVFVALTLVTGLLPIRLAEKRLERYEWEQ